MGFSKHEAEWNEEVNHAEILGGRGAHSRRRDKVPKCSGGNEVGSSRNKVGGPGAGAMRYTTQVRGWPDGGPREELRFCLRVMRSHWGFSRLEKLEEAKSKCWSQLLSPQNARARLRAPHPRTGFLCHVLARWPRRAT